MILDVAIGVCAVDAFSDSATPDIQVNQDRPPRGWLFRTRCIVMDDGANPGPPVKCMGDMRGKRKLDNGILYLKTRASSFSGTTFSVATGGIIRTLYLLP